MAETIIVSIIIPVYKTEKYLRACVESVLAQDYPYLDIILVDDGSPDDSGAICDEYAAKYENIRAIHKENGGLGRARNTGIDASKGKYVFFLDSDDMMDGTEAVSILVRKAEEKQADIVCGSFRRFTDAGGESGVNFHHLRDGEYTRTLDFRFKGFYMYGHLAYDWGKLYLKEFMEKNDCRCMPYPFTQDKAHNMQCCALEPVYGFVDDSIVRYRDNEESVSYRYKENLLPVWIAIAGDFAEFLKERKIEKDLGDLPAFHIFFGSFFIVKQELPHSGVRGAVREIKKYGRDPFVKDMMKILAKGKYVNKIGSVSWKIMIRGASILFYLHWYHIFVWGIRLLRSGGVDKKITKSRYQD